VIEFAGNGHADPLFLAALVAAVGLASGGRLSRWGAAAAYGAAVALRAVPIVAAPFFLRPLGARLFLSLVVAAASAVPFLEGEPGAASPLAGAREYATRWRHNDSAFRSLLEISEWRQEEIEARGTPRMRDRVRDHRDDFNPLAGAKTMAVVLYLAGLAAIAALRRSLPTSIGLALLLLLLLSPTVHPWYVAWLVPLAALGSRPAPALAFSATAFLSYHVLVGREPGSAEPWREDGLLVALEYVPVYAALAFETARAVRRARGPA
jgi:hypothetical protein